MMGDPTARLLELDARHGELLDHLVILDEQIESILSGWMQIKDIFPEKSIDDTNSESIIAFPDAR